MARSVCEDPLARASGAPTRLESGVA
jgi:hypothetical protein